MPKLWDETIEAHRKSVRDAILDTAAALVAEHGLRGVTMSEIAEKTGIGRATLYKYFSDVEAILASWLSDQIAHHLEHLTHVRDSYEDTGERLSAVLEAFALIQLEVGEHHHSGPDSTELASLLHGEEGVVTAQQGLHEMIGDLVADAAKSGHVRDDVGPEELATYCIHALTAAGKLSSPAAVHRLVEVTLSGLRSGALGSLTLPSLMLGE